MSGPPALEYAPPRKSSTWKWVLGGCLGATVLLLILVAVGGYFISKAVTMEPARVEEIANGLLDFETPPGAQGLFAVEMMGFTMAMVAPEGMDLSGDSFALTLMSLPGAAGKDPEELKKQMRDQMRRQGHGLSVEEELEPQVFRVRGEEVPAEVQIGRGGSEERAIQYLLLIEGRTKPVLLLLMGGEGHLDHAAVQGFLDTVR